MKIILKSIQYPSIPNLWTQDKLGSAEISLQKMEDLVTVFGLHLNLVVTMGLHFKVIFPEFCVLKSFNSRLFSTT